MIIISIYIYFISISPHLRLNICIISSSSLTVAFEKKFLHFVYRYCTYSEPRLQLYATTVRLFLFQTLANYSFITQLLHNWSISPTPCSYPLHLPLKLLNLEERKKQTNTAVGSWPPHELYLILNIEIAMITVNKLTGSRRVLMLMNGKGDSFIFLLFEATAVLNEVNDTLLPGSGAGEPSRGWLTSVCCRERIFSFISPLAPRFFLMGRQGANVPGGQNKKVIVLICILHRVTSASPSHNGV